MIPRRGLLGLLGCAVAPLPAASPVEAVGALFDAAPERVGHRYLAAGPDNAREAVAMAHKLTTEARDLRLPLTTQVGDRIRDDFAAGRIVLVDGWVLSVTEARGCACRVLAG